MLTIDPSTRILERVGDGLERHVRPPIKTTFFRSRGDCWNVSITAEKDDAGDTLQLTKQLQPRAASVG
jgi:hypothetical protein